MEVLADEIALLVPKVTYYYLGLSMEMGNGLVVLGNHESTGTVVDAKPKARSQDG